MGSSLFDLTGKVALVTGSASGLGRAMAEGLATAGAHVVLNGRKEVTLAAAADELRERGLAVSSRAFDVTDTASVSAACQAVEDSLGSIDILINNVGLRNRRDIFEFEAGDMERMLEVNLVAPFELARRVAPGMIRRRWGRIINLISVVSRIAGPGDATYMAAKGGLESLTRALAAEFGPHGITVNGISPGFFETEPNAERVGDPALSRWLEGRTALGRWAKPAEIGGAAVFLASEEAAYVTGHVLAVDGGMLAHI